MDTCGICHQEVVQLFETGKEGVFACYKCQPLVPEVSLGQEQVTEEHSPGTNDASAENDKDLYCALCNKTFQKNQQLQNHLRNHRAERRFVCTYCNKAFSQSNNLRAHLRIHTNERPYKCHVCDKAFTQVTNLNNHVRLHTGERPFVCPEPGCNKAYAQVTNLNQHRKRHINGKPIEAYVCTVCGEQFDSRQQMFIHRRELHGDPKQPRPERHACKICTEKFTTEKQLINHVAEHMCSKLQKSNDESPSPLPCVFGSCSATFTCHADHTEHLLRAHQLRVLGVPARQERRGRPPKISKGDPLDLKSHSSYEIQVNQLKEQSQFLPKLKVQSLFQ